MIPDLQQLSDLVNKSLVSHDAGTGRLEIHELLRSFAQEKLEDNPDDFQAARKEHGIYFADFMEQSWDLLRSPQQQETLEEIKADMENVRSAWSFFLDDVELIQDILNHYSIESHMARDIGPTSSMGQLNASTMGLKSLRKGKVTLWNIGIWEERG